MRKRIPREILCELESEGGLPEIARSVPGRKKLNAVAALHSVLSDGVRLQILLSLRGRNLCVCVLKKLAACPDTRLSYHLATLKRAGLVASERDRSFLRYSLTKKGRKAVDSFLEELNEE